METQVKSGRVLESDIEQLIEKLGAQASRIKPGNLECVTGEDRNPELKVQLKLEQKLDELKQLSLQIRKSANTKTEQTYANQFQASHAFLNKEFRRITANIRALRQSAELVGDAQGKEDQPNIKLLVKEAASLDNTLETTSLIITNANSMKTSFNNQREKLNAAEEKIVSFAETIPGINTLLFKIERRKRCNAIVIALAFAICICFLLLYTF